MTSRPSCWIRREISWTRPINTMKIWPNAFKTPFSRYFSITRRFRVTHKVILYACGSSWDFIQSLYICKWGSLSKADERGARRARLGSSDCFVFSQHELLSSEREDLAARLETLQSNVTQLETQILETQKLKSALERDLEAERILREQKSKVQTPSDTHLSLSQCFCEVWATVFCCRSFSLRSGRWRSSRFSSADTDSSSSKRLRSSSSCARQDQTSCWLWQDTITFSQVPLLWHF